MLFETQPFQEKIEKPWGYEIIFTKKDSQQTGKILHVLAGKKLSLQYHDEKVETLCLFSGQAKIWLENSSGEIEKISMQLGHGYRVEPMQKHRIEAVTECDVFEVSSPETGNTFRISDEYERPTETEELRKQKNRGWI